LTIFMKYENTASLSEIEAGLLRGLLSRYTLMIQGVCCAFIWNRSWITKGVLSTCILMKIMRR